MYPYELDEFLTIEIDNNKKEITNKLLEETSKDIENCKPKIFQHSLLTSAKISGITQLQ